MVDNNEGVSGENNNNSSSSGGLGALDIKRTKELDSLLKLEDVYESQSECTRREEVLGELFSYFILETAIIGQLSNINPFNQPAVEQVKINTKKKLN